MIRISVIPCLSGGLARNNKIISMFVLFSCLFGQFEILAFLSKMGHKPYTKAVKQDVLVNFSKIQQLSNRFSKNRGYFD